MNIACGEAVTVNELFRILRDLTGAEGIEPVYEPPRQGDVRHSLADIARARERLGYAPGVSLREGLEKTLAWYRREMD
jgi:nucleoside-diphosphate-sugar epimerase